MPLLSGSADEVMNENVAELRRSGYPEDQAVAIALKKQRESQKSEDEQASNPLAAAAARAKRVREGKTSAVDAANAGGEQSPEVDELADADDVKAKKPVASPAPAKKIAPAKALPKFKTRGASSHTTRK